MLAPPISAIFFNEHVSRNYYAARPGAQRCCNKGGSPFEGSNTELAIMAYQKRLKKEYEEMSKRAPVGISLDPSTMEDNIDM